MALRNAFGGLALDETLKQMIAKMRDWTDPEWVTSHPDMPVHVDGQVKSKPSMVNSTLVPFSGTTGTMVLAATNLQRSALSIYNASSAEILYVLCAPGTVKISNQAFWTVKIGIDEYWELPFGDTGCYKGIITALWATGVTGPALVTEYSVI